MTGCDLAELGRRALCPYIGRASVGPSETKTGTAAPRPCGELVGLGFWAAADSTFFRSASRAARS